MRILPDFRKVLSVAVAVGCLLHVLPFCGVCRVGVCRAADPAAAAVLPDSNRAFGTIFNNDANNILYALDEGDSARKIISDYSAAVRQIAEARPGIMAQNVGNPDPVIYRSGEATAWSKYIRGHESAVMNKMLEAGTDPLQVTIEVCREHGVPVIASYRMNAEDFYEEGLEIQDFGRRHRHLAIPGAFCLDPAHPVVYQHRMAIFREVAENYDIDGIEFDFRRWTHMISDPLTNHPILTRMVRETRQMLNEVARQKGRKRMILGARVGPSLDTPQDVALYAGLSAKGRKVDPSCRELGLDVRTWVDEGLVDYLSPSLFWPDWPGLPLTGEFAELVRGKNIGVYPTIFPRPPWLNDSGEVENRGPIEPWNTELLQEYKQGFCSLGLRCYDEGADGVSMYNWYFHLHLSRVPRQWQAYYGYGMGGSPVQKYALSVLGNPAALRQYQQQPWFWPPEFQSLLSDVVPVDPFIRVQNPRRLPAEVPAGRVRVGIANAVRPCLGVLPSSEILLLMQHTYDDLEDGKIRDEIYLAGSTDGGKRWSHRRLLPLLGRDPGLTVLRDGSLMVVASLMPNDTGNTTGRPAAFVHRSADGGKRWTSWRIDFPDTADDSAGARVMTSRNVLELSDGTLLVGISTSSGSNALWISRDQGVTWDKSDSFRAPSTDGGPAHVACFGNAFLWETRQGDIVSLIGSGTRASAVASDGSSSPADQPSASRIALFRSTDRGQTWTPAAEPDMSFPGQHPALIRLRDGRCLLTFTVPGSSASAGLQAVLIQETDNGFTAELQTDRLMAERRTLPDQPGGGGLGNTVQLPDGRMISAGTWRDGRGTPFVEAVSWDLPASR